jgi:hypothetical protein
MFFSIGKSTNKILSQVAPELHLDQGWNKTGNVYYKGYCITQDLHSKVKAKDFTEETGNYTIIDLDNHCLYHDNARSYPLYFSKDTASNIYFESSEPVWYNGYITYNKQWQWGIPKPITAPSQEYNFDAIVDKSCGILLATCENLNTDLPLVVPDTNGVDTACVASALDYLSIPYETQTGSSYNEQFTWGYKQVLKLDYPHMQGTGFCGDECLLRNPKYCQLLLNAHNIDLTKEFDKIKQSYMLGFFNRYYRNKIHLDKDENARLNVKNQIVNDYQMWHINDTITFTPFKNIELIDLSLCADADTIIRQVTHAELSFAIIKRLNPTNLQRVRMHKNGVVA